MNIKSVCGFLFLMFGMVIVSGIAQSTIIKKHNFTYDTDTNVIEGNGLLWKRWDETVGLSIDNALEQYGSGGWRLASSSEMVDMYNIFIPSFDWSIALDENSSRGEFIDVNQYRNLVSIFGKSIDAFGGISDVLFGDDEDSDGLYRVAFAQYSDYDPVAGISADDSRLTSDYTNSGYSVQLVKAINVAAPSGLFLVLFFASLILSKANKSKLKIVH